MGYSRDIKGYAVGTEWGTPGFSPDMKGNGFALLGAKCRQVVLRESGGSSQRVL